MRSAFAAFLTGAALLAAPGGAAPAVYDIPPVDGITIDGRADDWGDRGFRVDLVPDPEGRFLPAADFDVRFRLGWSGGGLAVLVEVSDDIAHEHTELKRLWQEDCVELFISDSPGGGDMVQIVLAPGADERFDSLRTKVYDHRSEGRDRAIRVPCAAVVAEGGYTLELLFPAGSIGADLSTGEVLGFQLIANDSDDVSGESFRAAWYPATGTHEDTKSMHGIRIAGEASPPVTLHAVRRSAPRGCEVILTGAREEAGAVYSAASGERRIEGVLESVEGRAGAVIRFGGSSGTVMCPAVEIEVSGREAASFPPVASLKRVLERYVEALGGREALERISSRRCLCESVTEPLEADDDGKAGAPHFFSVTVDSSGRWLYEDLSSDPPARRGSDGSTGWVLDENGLRREDLSGWGVTVWWIDPRGPLRLEKYFSGLELVPPGAEDDGRFHEARGMLPGGREIRFLFDRESGLLEKAGRLVFSGYRTAGDVMLPHLVYFDTGGSRTKFTITEVETGIDLEDGMFEIPDPAGRFPDIFSGITDPKVLPMLKDLPSVHGGMNVPAADGRFLYDLILERGYRRGLEIGTSNGYSALWMGLAFRKTGGSLITIEYEKLRGLEAGDNFEKAGLDGVIDLRINDAFEEIPSIDGQFDFVFLDAWKPDYIKFLELVRGRVVPGGAIAAHNVVAQENSMRDFLEAIGNDPGLETEFIETSTEGISLSTVKR